MKNTIPVVEQAVEEKAVHPMHKSYMFISSKHVDYNNLSAIEAGAMTLALVLSTVIGTLAVVKS